MSTELILCINENSCKKYIYLLQIEVFWYKFQFHENEIPFGVIELLN